MKITRYELLRAIPVDNIGRMILELVKLYPTEEEITELLKSELEEEVLQVVNRVAQSSNSAYPLFFDGKQ